MKVLIWTQYFWPENFVINKLVSDLCEQGIDVTVLTGKPNYPEGRIFPGFRQWGVQHSQYSNAEVIRVPLMPRGRGGALGLSLNYLSFILSGYLVAPTVLREKQFDAVFIFAPSPLLQALPAIRIATTRQVPSVLWVQDIWPEALQSTGFVTNKSFLKAVKAVVKYIYRNSTSILIQSEAFRAPVENLVDTPAKIRFFPNSADDVSTDNEHSTAQWATRISNSFSVVFAGNLGKAQSCGTILDAAELLRDHPGITIYLAGAGSQFNSIAAQITLRDLSNVVMTGRLPAAGMGAIYSAASVLLLTLGKDPSLALTIPSKLQRYMLAGKPIVVAADGEAARLVDEAGAGLSGPAGDSALLAQRILQMHAMSDEDRLRLGSNALRYYKEHFRGEERVTELVSLFGELTGHPFTIDAESGLE